MRKGLSASLDANGASAFYTLDATGSPETLSISLDWTNTGGGNWAADVAVAITSPDGNCIAVGGYNSSPAGCSSIGDYMEAVGLAVEHVGHLHRRRGPERQ